MHGADIGIHAQIDKLRSRERPVPAKRHFGRIISKVLGLEGKQLTI